MARRTIQEAAANLTQVAAAGIIGPRYIAGVQKADWQTAASSAQAETNYAEGVQRAVAAGTRRAGILAVSNQQWQQASEQKGGPIIGQRVQGGIAKYSQNFGPILQAMNSAADALPPRTTSPSQNITNRMIPIVRAAVEASGKTFS
jgi:hypothetical protein